MSKHKVKGLAFDEQSITILAAAAVILIIFSFRFILPVNTAPEPPEESPVSCRTEHFSGIPDQLDRFAFYESRRIELPQLAFNAEVDTSVLGFAHEERFIEVVLSEQKLYAWEGDRLFVETKISSGLPRTPTPTGEFRVWIKLRATKMSGGTGRNYYYLPNVPYVMFFYNDKVPKHKGYGLHGTYWHNDFGNPRSHGCINLPTPLAKEIYEWAGPVLPPGKSVVYATEANPGARIVIRE
jgi:hypothetical protein